MYKRIMLIAIALAILVSSAQAETYKLDRSHSYIGFTVSHMTVSKVKGSFAEFDGTLSYDPADPTKSAVEVVVQTPSIDTRNENRDKHLRSGDFFLADSFPTMTFKSTKVEKKGEGKFDITGDLTLRGVTKPITLSAEMTGMLEDPNMGKRMGFTATGKLNRQDYGVSWSKTLDAGGLVAGNDVELNIEVEAVVPREPKQ